MRWRKLEEQVSQWWKTWAITRGVVGNLGANLLVERLGEWRSEGSGELGQLFKDAYKRSSIIELNDHLINQSTTSYNDNIFQPFLVFN